MSFLMACRRSRGGPRVTPGCRWHEYICSQGGPGDGYAPLDLCGRARGPALDALRHERRARGPALDALRHERRARGPALEPLRRARRPYEDFFRRFLGRVVDDGQKSLSTHSSQRGRRAMHTRLPCRISLSDSPVHSLGGTIAVTCLSIFTGSRVEASPRRFVSRVTCVSTAKPGTPKPTPRMTFAVLRPIPGSVTRSSIRGGTTPPKSSVSFRAAAMIERVLARKKPVGLITSSTLAGSAAARSAAVGYSENSFGVTRFTVRSVVCADRIVAISS